jgi:hypothetical protein
MGTPTWTVLLDMALAAMPCLGGSFAILLLRLWCFGERPGMVRDALMLAAGYAGAMALLAYWMLKSDARKEKPHAQ